MNLTWSEETSGISSFSLSNARAFKEKTAHHAHFIKLQENSVNIFNHLE
jgi:Fe2+ or Zn2+ uptake regulation protein